MAVLSVACSRQKTLSRDDLRSKVKSAISLATEGQVFLGYVREQRPTRAFAKGHVEYLGDELAKAEQELGHSTPEPGIEPALREYQTNLDALRLELPNISTIISNPTAQPDLEERLVNIRKALESANRRL